MKSFMTEKNFKKILKQDAAIPQNIEDRLNETFSSIKTVSSSSNLSPKLYHKTLRFLTAAACCIVLFLIFGFSNPALASKLPVIGALFKTDSPTPAADSVISYLQSTKDWGYLETLHNNHIDSSDYIVVHQKLNPQLSSDVSGVEIYLEELFCNGYDFLMTYRIVDPNRIFPSNAVSITNKAGAPVMSINGLSVDISQENMLCAKRETDDTFVGYAYCDISSTAHSELFESLKEEQEFSFSWNISELRNDMLQEITTPDGHSYSVQYEAFVPSSFLNDEWSIEYTAPISRANVISYDFTEDTDLFTTASLVVTSCSTHLIFDGVPDEDLSEKYEFFFMPSLDQGHLTFQFISAVSSTFSYQASMEAIPEEAEQFQITLYATEGSAKEKDTSSSHVLFQEIIDL